MRFPCFLLTAALLVAGCTPHQRSPDEIREQTAQATATAARDAKAVVQGVVEGVREQHTINLNRSPVEELEKLPGIDDTTARRIVDNRPYHDSYELVKRHIVSRTEYNRIAGKIETR